MTVFCRSLFLLTWFFTATIFSVNVLNAKEQQEKKVREYIKPSDVSDDVWSEVKPYLLPFDHPLKNKLDKLFTTFRVTDNPATVKKAGFLRSTPAAFSNAIVSRNENLSGYYFKFYHDHQQIDVESKQWIDRAFEARSLKKAIKDHGYQKYFKVPKKWIYLIPDNPQSTGPYPKHFILIATKINTTKGHINRFKWQTEVSRKLLDAVWIINQQEGLVDSCVGHNLPFTKDNKLAYIDLEQHHKWPVPFHRLNGYLNPEMQDYWKKLIDNNGP